MLTPKSLTYELDTTGLSMNHVASLFQNIFIRKDYDWWYEVLPDDVVVDIGASIGIFSAKALDAGAKKIYMVEPNKVLLKTAIKNTSEAFINNQVPKIVPINAAVGRTDIDLDNVFQSATLKDSQADYKLMGFRELVDTYKIGFIDYLKVNAAGAEYNILRVDNIDFFTNNVRHIAVKCHINAQYGSREKFAEWRDNFLRHFIQMDKVRFQDSSLQQKIFAENWFELVPQEFMVYITNY